MPAQGHPGQEQVQAEGQGEAGHGRRAQGGQGEGEACLQVLQDQGGSWRVHRGFIIWKVDVLHRENILNEGVISSFCSLFKVL